MVITRDSVCAGDDADAPHRTFRYIEAVQDPVTLARELSAGYLASVAGAGHSWTCVLNGVRIATIAVSDIRPLVARCTLADDNTVHFIYHSATY